MTKTDLEKELSGLRKQLADREEYITKLEADQQVLSVALERFQAKVDRMRKAHQNLLDITSNADW